MRQILHLRKLNKEKVLTDEEYLCAINSYFIGMDSERLIENILILVAGISVYRIVCEMFNGINKNDKQEVKRI